MNNNQARQGDIYFTRVEEGTIPEEAEVIKDGIIARGESTGHTHMISNASQAVLMMVAGIAYIKAMQDCQIVHQEHGTIDLPAGEWQITYQKQYTPKGWNPILD